MKRFIIGVLALFMMTMTYATLVPSNQEVRFVRVHESNDYAESDFEELISEYVPEKYIEAFNYYTQLDDPNETNNLRLQILAIGEHETEWKPLTSKKNKNGSVDKGYLQLNSDNIKDDWFMYRFGPKESDYYQYDTSDEMELYLITCIKLYKSLYLKYGDDAAYCYNGGESRYLKHKLPPATITYKLKVNNKLLDIKNRLEEIKDDREYFEEGMYLRSIGTSITVANFEATENYNNMQKYHSITVPEVLIYYDKKKMIAIVKSSRVRVRVNTDYVFVGYGRIKDTGALTPVFLHRPTGKTIYC